ncbi:MAG: formyltransferase family protein [Deltaproteobacteria bacterium]|nr:formyltransferase family protein [Deltaproteobacteria bacterium]
MRVLIITQEDPLFLPFYFDRLLPQTAGAVVEVVALPSFTSLRQTLVYPMELFGPALYPYVGALVVGRWAGAALLGRLGRPHALDVEGACRKWRTPFRRLRKINDPAALAHLRSLRPDVLFSLAAPQRFRAELLGLAPRGCFNIHSALLPRYRGINAIFWAMLHDEPETGFSIHRMDADLDTGPVVAQQPVPIAPGDSYQDVCRKVMTAGADAIADFFRALAASPDEPAVIRAAAEAGAGRYYSFPRAPERREFRRKGKRFFRYL